MKISAVILTKNEEDNIEPCIKSLTFCDEVLVIDDNSSDKTRDIAKKMGAKVLERNLDGDFAAQRNFGLQEAKFDWVFFIDADERVSDNLKREIETVVSKDSLVKGYFVKRVDNFMGKLLTHGETGNFFIIRIIKKNSGKWVRKVHETYDLYGSFKKLKNPLFHEKGNLSSFVDKINFYSSLHAKANYEEGKRSNILKIIFFPILKFKLNYFFKFGFLDGTAGIVHALLMSFHSFLSWGKLWLLQKKSQFKNS